MIRIAILALLLTATAHAAPPGGEVSVTERVGARVPLDDAFIAARHGPITLHQIVDGKRPVLLVLAYARCEMLCSIVLRGVVQAVRGLDREYRRAPDRDYKLVVISFDPRETLDEAARVQGSLLEQIGRSDEDAWHYLVGARASIDAVADALGVRYSWDPRTKQFAHPAAIYVLAPDGRIARYLHGLEFAADEVAHALDDASAYRFLPSEASAVLRCFRYDPAAHRFAGPAQRFLRIGAACVFALTFGVVVLLIARRRR